MGRGLGAGLGRQQGQAVAPDHVGLVPRVARAFEVGNGGCTPFEFLMSRRAA